MHVEAGQGDGPAYPTTKIAVVGCGYVFDIYMRTKWAHPELEIVGVFDLDDARLSVVERHYGLRRYDSLDALLADPKVELVVNLTSIGSHHEVSRRALDSGRHVYSEKPLSRSLEEVRALFEVARANGVTFTGAPCNLYSDAIGTIWKAVRDGAIGRPSLVYAELDDNPAHLMRLEEVRSPTGAPFPYREELQEGCTVEHIAYHLAWLCALFGPVQNVTGFSKHLVEKRTPLPLDPADTPDFSVGCLTFANGAAARVTCSWVAPRDHRIRIIGDEGEIAADNVFHDQSPVRLERFSRVSLTARKAYSLRRHAALGALFGIGGRRLKLVRRWKSFAVEAEKGVGSSLKHRFVSALRRREVYAQDKFLGIAEMIRAIADGRPQPMPEDFQLHVTELTAMIHGAGPGGVAAAPTTTFMPLDLPQDVAAAPVDYRRTHREGRLEGLLARAIGALHR